MVTMEQIEEFSRNLVQEFQPLKVILFGSYAKGIMTPDSDVDLLVILPFEGKSVFKSVEMRLTGYDAGIAYRKDQTNLRHAKEKTHD